MSENELCFLRSTELAAKLRRREVSAVEVTEAHLKQIERVNPKVNAIVTLVPEQALEAARKADEHLVKGEIPGMLHGLPVAHKDLVETKGIRTTYGSPIYKDHVPEFDCLIVERMKAPGQSPSEKPIPRNSERAPRPSTKFSVPPAIPTTPTSPAEGAAVARRFPSPAGCFHWRTAAISEDL